MIVAVICMKGEDVTQRTRRAPWLHAVIEAYSQTACALQVLDHVHAAGDGLADRLRYSHIQDSRAQLKHRM